MVFQPIYTTLLVYMYMLSLYIFVNVDMYSIHNFSFYYNCLLSNISNNHFMKFNYIAIPYFIKDSLLSV